MFNVRIVDMTLHCCIHSNCMLEKQIYFEGIYGFKEYYEKVGGFCVINIIHYKVNLFKQVHSRY